MVLQFYDILSMLVLLGTSTTSMSVAKSSCPVLDNPSTPVKTQLASKPSVFAKERFCLWSTLHFRMLGLPDFTWFHNDALRSGSMTQYDSAAWFPLSAQSTAGSSTCFTWLKPRAPKQTASQGAVKKCQTCQIKSFHNSSIILLLENKVFKFYDFPFAGSSGSRERKKCLPASKWLPTVACLFHRCLPHDSDQWQGLRRKFVAQHQMAKWASWQDKCRTNAKHTEFTSLVFQPKKWFRHSVSYHSVRSPDFMIFHDIPAALLKPTVHAVRRVSGRDPVSVKMCQNHILSEQMVGLHDVQAQVCFFECVRVCVCVWLLFFLSKMILRNYSAPDCFAQKCTEISGNPLDQQGQGTAE